MCGCQGNNKPFTPPAVTLPSDGYVMVRYTGHRGGINPYPGANGGYRFGTQRRDGIVTTEDAQRLLALHEGGKPAFVLVAEPEAPASPAGGEQKTPDDNPKPPSGNEGEQPPSGDEGGEQPPPDPVVTVPPPIKPPPIKPPPVQRSTAPKPATKPVGKHKPGAKGK